MQKFNKTKKFTDKFPSPFVGIGEDVEDGGNLILYDIPLIWWIKWDDRYFVCHFQDEITDDEGLIKSERHVHFEVDKEYCENWNDLCESQDTTVARSTNIIVSDFFEDPENPVDYKRNIYTVSKKSFEDMYIVKAELINPLDLILDLVENQNADPTA